jgi:hypothetical protein
MIASKLTGLQNGTAAPSAQPVRRARRVTGLPTTARCMGTRSALRGAAEQPAKLREPMLVAAGALPP